MDSRALFAEIDRRLAGLYGDPRLDRQEPLSLLVRTILSQNTTDRNRDRAFASLCNRWASWEDVLSAPVGELAEAIKGAGLHQQRAQRIHAVLQRISDEQGSLQLDFLGKLVPADAEAWLLTLPGVGKKTAYIVLSMGFSLPRFPVDTHIQRVATRLGVVSERADPHETLAPLVPPRREIPLHLNLIRLGREVCRARRPQCADCPLPDLCPLVLDKTDPQLRSALQDGAKLPVLVRHTGGTSTAYPDRRGLLALLSDPQTLYVEAAPAAAPKEAL